MLIPLGSSDSRTHPVQGSACVRTFAMHHRPAAVLVMACLFMTIYGQVDDEISTSTRQVVPNIVTEMERVEAMSDTLDGTEISPAERGVLSRTFEKVGASLLHLEHGVPSTEEMRRALAPMRPRRYPSSDSTNNGISGVPRKKKEEANAEKMALGESVSEMDLGGLREMYADCEEDLKRMVSSSELKEAEDETPLAVLKAQCKKLQIAINLKQRNAQARIHSNRFGSVSAKR